MSIRSLVLALLVALPLAAQDTRYPPEGNQIPGPGQMHGIFDFIDWLTDLRQWRHERLIRMGYDDAEYRRPELLWTQKNFVSPQAMVEDRYFYDPERRVYTINRVRIAAH